MSDNTKQLSNKHIQLIEEISNKFSTHDKFFNGKNIESVSRINKINIPNNERFPIVFPGGLSFLNNNFIEPSD